jgi:hypothetical protein
MTNPYSDVQIILHRRRVRFGFAYGLVCGFLYALTIWLQDTIALSTAHVPYVWLRLILGILGFTLVGGLAGWLTAIANRAWIGMVLWIGTAVVFAWLTVYVPYGIIPSIVNRIDFRLTGWMQTSADSALQTRMWVNFTWLAIFCAIVGAFEPFLIETASFSRSAGGKLILAIPAILMLISGTMTDDLINKPFRAPIVNIDNLIRFILANEGKPIDKTLYRTMRVASTFGDFRDVLNRPRMLLLGKSDIASENIDVLVNLGDIWINCETISEQPAFCKQVTSPP